MLKEDKFSELLANVWIVDAHRWLFGNMKQTNPAVALDDGFHEEESMISVNWAVSHVRT